MSNFDLPEKQERLPHPEIIQMVEKFQCPGCVCGSDTQCGRFEWNTAMCVGHVLGTFASYGHFALGLPRGFCRPGFDGISELKNVIDVRFWHDPTEDMPWDKLNFPVWALELDGYLFVRTYAPRINRGTVDIIKGGTLALVPNALDVSAFYDDID